MEFRSNFRRFIPILVFFILSILPPILFAQRDLGIPIREPIVWGAYVGPGKEGNLDTIYLSLNFWEACNYRIFRDKCKVKILLYYITKVLYCMPGFVILYLKS